MSMLEDPGVVAGLEDLEPGRSRTSAAREPVFQASMQDLDSGLTHFSPDELPEFVAPDEEAELAEEIGRAHV